MRCWSLKSGQRSEQTAGHTALVRVAQELSIEFLVPGQSQTLALSNLMKCFVQNVDIGVGHPAHTVVAELLDTDRTVAFRGKLEIFLLKIFLLLPSTSMVLNWASMKNLKASGRSS